MATSGKIFISYRRSDSSKDARAVYERLCREFGEQKVFIDLEGIAPGDDFVELLEHNLDGCEVLVAVIGPGWASARSEQGALRLLEPDDFVRIELRTALGRGIKVFPVLVDGAPPLRAEQLPEDLQALVRRQAVALDYRRFDADVKQLVRAIRAESGLAVRRWLPYVLGSLFLVGAAALFLMSRLGDASTDAERTPPQAPAPAIGQAPTPPSVPPAEGAQAAPSDLLRQLKAANVRNSVGDRTAEDWLDDPDRHYRRLAEGCLRLIGSAKLSAAGADLDKIGYLYGQAIGLKDGELMPPEHRVDAALLAKAMVDAYNDKNGSAATELTQVLQ